MSNARGHVSYERERTSSAGLIGPGEVLADKYMIERLIGEGGMAVVFAARHLGLDEMVAIKLLRPEVLDNEEVVARFACEAKATVRMRCEYAVKLLDVGVSTRRGPFIVMELLKGRDVRTVLNEDGALPMRRAAEFSLQICEALAVAHANGIVHRDLKPENLFVVQQGELQVIKVLDFGISKTSLTGSVLNTDVGRFKTTILAGSPAYMSPEQFRGSTDTDCRSDIWSLGIVLSEMLSGNTPFFAETITELCSLVLEAEPLPVLRGIKGVSEELQSVIARCLEKNRNARFRNVGELAVALMPFAPSRARNCAERAISTLRAAGHKIDATFESGRPPALDGVFVRTDVSPALAQANTRSDRCGARPRVTSSQGRISRNLPGRCSDGQSISSTADTQLVEKDPGSDLRVDAMPTTGSRVGHGRAVVPLGIVACLLVATAGYLRLGRANRGPSASAAEGAAAAMVAKAVAVESKPSGMRVEWNGRTLGETPLKARLPFGKQIVVLTGEGYERKTVELDVVGDINDNAPIYVVLDRLPGVPAPQEGSPTVDASQSPKGLQGGRRAAARKASAGGDNATTNGAAGSATAILEPKPSASQTQSPKSKLVDDVKRVPIVD